MTKEQLESALRDHAFGGFSHFDLLREVAVQQNLDPASSDGIDSMIRVLDRRDEFPPALERVIDSLALNVGLYPYVNEESLGMMDGLTVELHRPLHFDGDTVFHELQNTVYRMLVDGQSVILSAPTSFGKSLVIDGVIASLVYSNIVVVVPTIALIDETRRRLQRFRDDYKVITHASQTRAAKNIFVLTQERALDFELPSIDFFVIDEFYKLGLEQDIERASLLNLAFYKLSKTAKAFYLLGPSIRAITDSARGTVPARFLATDFKTVISEVILVDRAERGIDGLLKLCQSLDEPTLIFVKSPNEARKVGMALAEKIVAKDAGVLDQLAEWIGDAYHPGWSYVEALKHGLALHHGRIPRALQQLSVRLFNEGLLQFLVCTSTLIEGVNTTAKNVIVYDNKIATRKYDYFTFNNIKGRAGRMRRHFIGRVFLFNEPPAESLPTVDIPILSQPDDLPLQVVVEMDAEDLSPGSADRISDVMKQQLLDVAVIRQNIGVDPERQVDFARDLRGRSEATLRQLSWHGYPNSAQLRALCDAMWSGFLKYFPRGAGGIFTAAQLQRSLTIAGRKTLKEWIDDDLVESGRTADEVVEEVLDFARNYCGFRFPRYARAAERIIKAEQARRGIPLANYSFFINQVESLFLPPIVSALDEYGVPSQISMRLVEVGALSDDLDEALLQVTSAAQAGLLPQLESLFVLNALGLTDITTFSTSN